MDYSRNKWIYKDTKIGEKVTLNENYSKKLNVVDKFNKN